MSVSEQILNGLRSSVGHNEFIPLHDPHFEGNEKKYVLECIETEWVSSVGKYVDKFEEMMAQTVGCEKAVAVVNGTAALHLGLKLLNVDPGDEVLVPSLTFVASVNAITYCGAKPHFVDSSFENLGIDCDKLENYLALNFEVRDGFCFNKSTQNKVKALMVVHILGHANEMERLCEITQKYNIEIIEDCAEALGSFYKETHLGNFGKVAAFSFNGNKIITTGGGGCLTTNDHTLGKRAKHLSTTAKSSKNYEFIHDSVGFNYRLPNINAALGCAQLEVFSTYLKDKKELSKWYESFFSSYEGVKFFLGPKYSTSNNWLNAITFESGMDVKEFLELSNSSGIMTRPMWKPMHSLPMYKDCPRMNLDGVEEIYHKVVTIPSGVKIARIFK